MKALRVYHAGRDSAHRERDRALVRAGVDVTLVVPSTWDEADDLTAEPFEVLQFPVFRPGNINRHVYASPEALRSLVERIRPDIVDLHEEPFSAVTHQVLGLLDPSQRVVGYTAQNIDKRFPPPFALWERQALGRLTGLYPCSRQAASVAVGKGYGGPLAVLPLAPAAAMTPGAVLEGPLGLLMVGRLVPEKGVVDAVHLLGRLRSSGARLHLVGSGPEAETARRVAGLLGISDRLDVTPWLGADDLAECYRRAHVVLAPSRSTAAWAEQFGRMVVEAQATGAVVVAYDSGALAEVVGDAGVVVPEGDEEALYAAVAALDADRRRWLELREAGLRLAATRTWDAVARGQVELYEQALAASPAPARPGRAAAVATWGPTALAAGSRRPLALPKRTPAAPAVPHRPLRVVYLDHVATPSGGELALVRLLAALPDVEAHVILGEDGPLVAALESVGAQVEVMPLATRTRRLRRAQVTPGVASTRAGASAATYAVRLAARLRELKPDLVHANSLKSGFYGGLAARLAGVPFVWHVRDRIAGDYLPSRAVRMTRTALQAVASGVVTDSSSVLSTLPPVTNAAVIPSPVSLAARARREGPPVVGIVGRLADWKGQDVFLRAFARLATNRPDLTARIVGSALFGEDHLEGDLRALAVTLGVADRVTFTGFAEDISAELARLTVLVHASTIPEPFGQVIVEGMATGVPVVATRGGGPSEIITNGVNGLLVAPGDDVALAAAIDTLLGDETLREALALVGRERAADYDPSVIGPRMRAFYDQILSGRR